jgi:hypothetical protein
VGDGVLFAAWLVFGIPEPPTNFGDELTEFAVVPGGPIYQIAGFGLRKSVGGIGCTRAGSAKEYEMKKLAAVLLTAGAMAAVPVAVAPAANAEVCAGADGRHFAAGGCTHIAGDVAVGAAIAAADNPYVPGEIPCYTVEGVPYYTPPGAPC